jgi:tetratricopeptide (TPR) repeat protein
VTFGELLARVSERGESGNPADFMDGSAITDLEQLRMLAQPSRPGRHTDEENLQVFVTEWAAGRLHQRRWAHLLHAGEDHYPAAAAELHQAILAFRAIMEVPSGLPPGVDIKDVPPLAKALFGVKPDGEMQGQMAYFLLANEPPGASRDYHSLAVTLLRSAVERIPHGHPDQAEWRRLLETADGRQRSPQLEWKQVVVEETLRWFMSPDGLEPSSSQDGVFERWEEITGRLRLRIQESLTQSRPELLDEAAIRDASRLAQAVHSAAEKLHPEEFQRKLDQAHRLGGLVHNFRAAARTFEEGHADLARAILFFAPFIDSDGVPVPAGVLIGKGADAEAQAHYATLLLRQAQATADSALIFAAIVVLAGAMLSLSEGAPEQPGYLGNIAVGYALRHQRTGTRRDLDQAIACAERSVALTARDDPKFAGRQSRVGGLYWERAERTRVPADYDQALKAQEDAVAAASDDDPNLGICLGNLARMHHERHIGRKRVAQLAPADLADRDAAILLAGRALTAAADRAAASRAQSRLATYHFDRYKDGHELTDLNQAIELHERLLPALGSSDPERLIVLANLALEYAARFAVNPALVLPGAPRSLASQIGPVEGGPPSHRIGAFRHVAALASAMGDDAAAAGLLAEAVQLLPDVVSPENEVEDREHLVGGHAGLVEEAIAAHCRAGDARGAVRASETGRGIVLPILAGSHRDLTALEDQHPGIAARFLRLRRTLNRPHGVLLGATSEQILGSRPFEPADRLLWQRDYGQLISEIRQLPAFEHFLLPGDPHDLRSAAQGGAVVLVNVDRRGGDAVVVKAGEDPLRIPLPGLRQADVLSNAQRILDTAHFGTGLTGRAMKLGVLPPVLAWLWETTVGPVLKALPPHPRIWWMPTGALTLFPLHAAGAAGQPGALDLALSSYTSTLRALARTRTCEAPPVRRQLTVVLQQTPGMPDLPAVSQEAAALHTTYPDALRLRDRSATTSRVLSELSKNTWVHFACHASTDYVAPSRGGLHLTDGVLAVTDISPLHLRHAELAYLSACSTANHGVRHANESISPATAFQLAGFRHIIASLWPLQDADAAMAARKFYDKMPDGPTADPAADVLRQVALELRSEHPDRPDLWAPLIHIGL